MSEKPKFTEIPPTAWNDLYEQLSTEPALLTTRLSPDYCKPCTHKIPRYIYRDGLFVAFAALWPTLHPSWYEVGSVWVHPDHRDQGLGSQVFKQVVNLQPAGIFLITSEDKIRHLATAADLQEVDLQSWQAVPWIASCGPCDKWKTNEQKQTCNLKATDELHSIL